MTGSDESAPWRNLVWLDQEQYPCEHCDAKPGARCQRPNGERAAFPHASRFLQYRDAKRKRMSNASALARGNGTTNEYR